MKWLAIFKENFIRGNEIRSSLCVTPFVFHSSQDSSKLFVDLFNCHILGCNGWNSTVNHFFDSKQWQWTERLSSFWQIDCSCFVSVPPSQRDIVCLGVLGQWPVQPNFYQKCWHSSALSKLTVHGWLHAHPIPSRMEARIIVSHSYFVLPLLG